MTTPMLYFGAAVTDASLRLTAVSCDDLFHRVRTDAGLRDQVERLRRVKQLDQAAYARMKVKLPFFCCGTFRDGVRRADHFVQIDAFVLDIDKYASDTEQLDALKERLRADVRVCMVFTSPGGDGVKILFLLDRPITDTKQFSDFYKAFAYRFGEQYSLTDRLDFRTFDVARACFLSSDAGAYFDPLCDRVVVDQYLDCVPETAGLVRVVKTEASEMTGAGLFAHVPVHDPVVDVLDAPQSVVHEPVNRSHQINPDVYKVILQRLGTHARPDPRKRDVQVPAALDRVVEPIRAALSDQGIEVVEVRNVQYGKQMELRSGNDVAAVNVYFSAKRGFSVVGVPRSGSHLDLMRLCVFVCEQVIFGGL